MKDRLREFLNKKELTAREFAEELGVQPSSISHILNGRNKASVDLLEKFIRAYPDFDVSYLISGIRTNVHSSEHEDRLPMENTAEEEPLNEEKKETDRIVVFFTDGTFKEYFPT